MRKFKVMVGLLAFVGLAVLNFTQSESSFVSKAMASSGDSSSSSSGSSSGNDRDYLWMSRLKEMDCDVTFENNTSNTVVWNGIEVPPHELCTINGTKLDCDLWLGGRCNQNLITLCHNIQN